MHPGHLNLAALLSFRPLPAPAAPGLQVRSASEVWHVWETSRGRHLTDPAVRSRHGSDALSRYVNVCCRAQHRREAQVRCTALRENFWPGPIQGKFYDQRPLPCIARLCDHSMIQLQVCGISEGVTQTRVVFTDVAGRWSRSHS